MGNLLALGVDLGAGGDDAVGLALPEGHLAAVLDDDVAGLAGGVGADDALDGLDGTDEGGLVLEGVEGEGHVLELEGHGRAAGLHALLLGGLHLETEAVVGALRLDHHARGAGGGLGRLGDDGGAREGGLWMDWKGGGMIVSVVSSRLRDSRSSGISSNRVTLSETLTA